MFPVWPSQDRPCSCRSSPPGATRCLQSVCKGGIRCKEDRNLRMPKLTWSDPKSFQILKWFIFVKRNAHKWNWVQACALRGKIETIIWNSNAVLQGIDGWSCEKPWWTNAEPAFTLPRYPATPVMETSLRLANVTPRKVLAWELQWLLTQYIKSVRNTLQSLFSRAEHAVSPE